MNDLLQTLKNGLPHGGVRLLESEELTAVIDSATALGSPSWI